jgi:RNA polymerase sigma-70 factor (ECF subfamily)
MPSDDDILIQRFGAGDTQAFAVLFTRYHRQVYNYARMVLHDPAAAEDMLQDTFVAATDAASRYEPRGHFRAWLLGICRHRCLDWLERRQRRERFATENGYLLLDSATADSPSQAVQRQEQLELTLAGLARLPVPQREAVTLHALRDLSYAEIAEVMDCPINTVKTLIRRGRLHLARLLAEAEGTES